MTAVLLTGPATEPVSLAEAKLHLRVDHDDEDLLISSLVTAARMHLERATRQAFITQSWLIVFDCWPHDRSVDLPLSPLRSVDGVTTYDDEDAGTVFDAGFYYLDMARRPARLVLRRDGSWPAPGRAANGIEIAVTAGYGDSANDVPHPLRQAMLLSLAHWYERRESVAIGATLVAMPQSVEALVAPFRQARLQ